MFWNVSVGSFLFITLFISYIFLFYTISYDFLHFFRWNMEEDCLITKLIIILQYHSICLWRCLKIDGALMIFFEITIPMEDEIFYVKTWWLIGKRTLRMFQLNANLYQCQLVYLLKHGYQKLCLAPREFCESWISTHLWNLHFYLILSKLKTFCCSNC